MYHAPVVRVTVLEYGTFMIILKYCIIKLYIYLIRLKTCEHEFKYFHVNISENFNISENYNYTTQSIMYCFNSYVLLSVIRFLLSIYMLLNVLSIK